ncbi:bifunctional SulP family inorganic anion transporter/carbonic anhydrase [Nannocystis exedens]|uniref:bifunctional SulP family inorganic anion transporter/carbonic anhydrase n=1 Tax=Nannocystis exedens TaxID=54 RepID=UPI000BBA07C2|nr:bifunctional SulP family inorganic anion transporter/carbonic anhydrase [Nannocystis exedens]PCC68838.1 sulfate permease [Nannocystis exedens]
MKRLRPRWDLGLRSLLRHEWRPLVSRDHLRADLIAGVTVACAAVPLSLAIALASGVTPGAGLVTAIVAGVVCALFGGMPLAISGPAVAMTVLTAAIVETHGISGLMLVVCVCGVLQLVTGVFRLGRFIWFVPVPVVLGLTAGIGALVVVAQLPRALGLPPPHASHIVDVVRHIGQYVGDAEASAIALSAAAAAVTLLLPWWLPQAPAVFVAVAIPTLLAAILHLDSPTLGALPPSLLASQLPTFPVEGLLSLLTASLMLYALASVETLFLSAAVDPRVPVARHDPDQELIGQGLGNLAAALSGGLPISGAISRTALNVQAGARTRRAALVQSVALLATVLVLGPVLGRIPLAALAGVLVAVALRMLNPREFLGLLRASRTDAAICGVTFAALVLGDLLFDVRTGFGAAFAIAVVRIVQIKVAVEPADQPDTARVVLRGSITRQSSLYIEALRAEVELLPARGAVIFELHEVTALDPSGAAMLARLFTDIDTRGRTIAIVGLAETHVAQLVAADPGGRIAARMAATETDVLRLLSPDHVTRPIERLIAGAQRFQQSPGRRRRLLIERLAKAQDPHTLFISCADSRVVPTLLTSTDPGELLQVRNLGNIVPPSGDAAMPAEGAAVEYALTRLRITEIVVCGHSGCGAMTALLTRDLAAGMPSVAEWLRPAAALLARLPADATPADAAMANVVLQLEHLRTYPIVRERLAAGQLQLHGWYYDIGVGALSAWDDDSEQFVALVGATPLSASDLAADVERVDLA